jgi:hypothetical protein
MANPGRAGPKAEMRRSWTNAAMMIVLLKFALGLALLVKGATALWRNS